MACVISLIDPNKNKVLKSLKIDDNYKNAENRVQELNKKINKKESNNPRFWSVTTIGV